jgi:hypothetical protein
MLMSKFIFFYKNTLARDTLYRVFLLQDRPDGQKEERANGG